MKRWLRSIYDPDWPVNPYIDGRAAEQAPGASRIYSNEAGLTTYRRVLRL